MSQQLFEKLVKKFKTHRAVINFDNRFVVAIVKMEQEGTSVLFDALKWNELMSFPFHMCPHKILFLNRERGLHT
jgi:hypothetical protein